MSVFRVSRVGDFVAAAVAAAGYLPSAGEFIAYRSSSVGLRVMGGLIAEDAGTAEAAQLAREFAGFTELDDEDVPVVGVTFGSREQAAVIGLALVLALPGTQCPIVAYVDGHAHAVGNTGDAPGDGEAVDLAAHPIVAAAVVSGMSRLMTREELRATFRPAQFGSAAAEAVARSVDHYEAAAVAVRPVDAARTVYARALSPYLEEEGEHGIHVSADHAAMLCAAANFFPVRDALFAEFTPERAERMAEVWRQVGASVPAHYAGAAFVLAGVCHWLDHDASMARESLDAALELAPTNRFGGLIRAAIATGMPPEVWSVIRTAILESLAVQGNSEDE